MITKQELIEKLNEDLAGEYAAVIQYTTYAAQVTGPYRPQLAAFFTSEVADELQHASFLANKITALGGTPTRVPSAVPAAESNREMVEHILAAERQAIKMYSQRAKEAEEYGDRGLVVSLDDIVRDETSHAEETERVLRDWPL